MRHEFKYMLSDTQAAEIKKILKKLSIKDLQHKKYTVHSLYFDAPTLDNFSEKIEGIYQRHKFRVRFLKNHTAIEKKCRKGLQVWKEKYISGKERNSTLSEFLAEYNSKKIIPIVNIIYTRHAYLWGTCRITLDSTMRTQVKNYIRPIHQGKTILEVKFINDTLPKQIHEIIVQNDLRRVSFSKYCEGVLAIYGNNPKSIIPEQFCINTIL